MKKIWKKQDALDLAIEKIEKILNDSDASAANDDYDKILERYQQLCDIRDKRDGPKVEPDTWVKILAVLLEIALVMNFERLNVITTKAWGFITKPRI